MDGLTSTTGDRIRSARDSHRVARVADGQWLAVAAFAFALILIALSGWQYTSETYWKPALVASSHGLTAVGKESPSGSLVSRGLSVHTRRKVSRRGTTAVRARPTLLSYARDDERRHHRPGVLP